MRILLIAPPNPHASRLDKAFRESTHGVERVDAWRDGCFAATQDRFDAIVIVATDGGAAAAILDELPRLAASAGGATIASIVAGTTSAQRAQLLNAGCDVCLAHPCSFVELHERLHALWRRAGIIAMRESIRLDTATRALEEQGRRLALSAREFRVVECLLREAGRPVGRDAVLRYAWDDADIEPETVNALVVRLRRKLVAHAFSARIETVARFGFRFDTGG
ncbi:winged helix-turn-helix domain-containing protein [Burkholderia cenocepacia]|uniref:response regulator transcription factor n=1 Tax=Burkholderia cenocepacia TaxID=95486 RepID=UPI000F578341|nr:winged helix-turn-helix domain-containing protein [Burkholderia cenocepacia]MBR8307379.1 response regulator transcription factor [Burkholderia cenocepacia]MDR8027315.1 winged helix-turn-helix domain-containing protein [Burkholderia cenocepacia]MDR8044567.1 winged helix-turn-helix domain-containing protein [Burkholderia cenocepacia]MDR8077937.1 winged helix-turn-helix domain-containing protein [Burkholderia cenocepacia]RQU79761.1 DNA-binding response regulator [Burkholderia cenocepacia]